MSVFANKVAVITGAASGIGRALAQQLATKGARLALSDVNAKGLDETMRSLPTGSDARSYALDVSSREAMFAHADDVKRDFGTAHCVVNNAGATVVGTFEHLSIEEIEWQLGVNLWGVIYGKFGVRGLTECLWSELEGTGVRAICVHPGGIKTNIEKAGRRCAASGEEEARFSQLADKLLQTTADECAADIIAGVERGRKRIITGHKSATLYWLSRLLPNAYPAVLKVVAK
jgi:NAD(P)-dependent dehydrogenase (short-subunit alcohol dehydrogenase family)